MDIHRNFMKQAQINLLCVSHYPKISGEAELQSDIADWGEFTIDSKKYLY